MTRKNAAAIPVEFVYTICYDSPVTNGDNSMYESRDEMASDPVLAKEMAYNRTVAADVDVRPLQQQMQRMVENLGMLEDSMAYVEDRLAPLRQMNPKGTDKAPQDKYGGSDVVAGLAGANDRIYRVRSRLNQLLEELEI